MRAAIADEVVARLAGAMKTVRCDFFRRSTARLSKLWTRSRKFSADMLAGIDATKSKRLTDGHRAKSRYRARKRIRAIQSS
jgi:hypothetical protein